MFGFNAIGGLTEDQERWYDLHFAKVFRAGDVAHILVPIPCREFDHQTNRCKIYEDRPEVCRNYACVTDAFHKNTTEG